MRFHDGSPLTAADVVYTYESAIDPSIGSPVAADLTSLASVEALDDLTVRFTLEHPQASFPVATVLGSSRRAATSKRARWSAPDLTR